MQDEGGCCKKKQIDVSSWFHQSCPNLLSKQWGLLFLVPGSVSLQLSLALQRWLVCLRKKKTEDERRRGERSCREKWRVKSWERRK